MAPTKDVLKMNNTRSISFAEAHMTL